MIQADAHTNPFTWRRCLHPSRALTVPYTVARCGDCRAILDDSIYTQRHHMVGLQSPVAADAVGSRPDDEPQHDDTCSKGHPRRLEGRVSAKGRHFKYPVCDTCQVDARAAVMASPCPNGHPSSKRSVSPSGAVHCIECRRIAWHRTKEKKRA